MADSGEKNSDRTDPKKKQQTATSRKVPLAAKRIGRGRISHLNVARSSGKSGERKKEASKGGERKGKETIAVSFEINRPLMEKDNSTVDNEERAEKVTDKSEQDDSGATVAKNIQELLNESDQEYYTAYESHEWNISTEVTENIVTAVLSQNTTGIPGQDHRTVTEEIQVLNQRDVETGRVSSTEDVPQKTGVTSTQDNKVATTNVADTSEQGDSIETGAQNLEEILTLESDGDNFTTDNAHVEGNTSTVVMENIATADGDQISAREETHSKEAETLEDVLKRKVETLEKENDQLRRDICGQLAAFQETHETYESSLKMIQNQNENFEKEKHELTRKFQEQMQHMQELFEMQISLVAKKSSETQVQRPESDDQENREVPPQYATGIPGQDHRTKTEEIQVENQTDVETDSVSSTEDVPQKTNVISTEDNKNVAATSEQEDSRDTGEQIIETISNLESDGAYFTTDNAHLEGKTSTEVKKSIATANVAASSEQEDGISLNTRDTGEQIIESISNLESDGDYFTTDNAHVEGKTSTEDKKSIATANVAATSEQEDGRDTGEQIIEAISNLESDGDYFTTDNAHVEGKTSTEVKKSIATADGDQLSAREETHSPEAETHEDVLKRILRKVDKLENENGELRRNLKEQMKQMQEQHKKGFKEMDRRINETQLQRQDGDDQDNIQLTQAEEQMKEKCVEMEKRITHLESHRQENIIQLIEQLNEQMQYTQEQNEKGFIEIDMRINERQLQRQDGNEQENRQINKEDVEGQVKQKCEEMEKRIIRGLESHRQEHVYQPIEQFQQQMQQMHDQINHMQEQLNNQLSHMDKRVSEIQSEEGDAHENRQLKEVDREIKEQIEEMEMRIEERQAHREETFEEQTKQIQKQLQDVQELQRQFRGVRSSARQTQKQEGDAQENIEFDDSFIQLSNRLDVIERRIENTEIQTQVTLTQQASKLENQTDFINLSLNVLEQKFSQFNFEMGNEKQQTKQIETRINNLRESLSEIDKKLMQSLSKIEKKFADLDAQRQDEKQRREKIGEDLRRQTEAADVAMSRHRQQCESFITAECDKIGNDLKHKTDEIRTKTIDYCEYRIKTECEKLSKETDQIKVKHGLLEARHGSRISNCEDEHRKFTESVKQTVEQLENRIKDQQETMAKEIDRKLSEFGEKMTEYDKRHHLKLGQLHTNLREYIDEENRRIQEQMNKLKHDTDYNVENNNKNLNANFLQSVYRIQILETMQNRAPIGFSARSVGCQLKIKFPALKCFNEVICNEGGHYQPSTGFFTAPVAGMYVLSLSHTQSDEGEIFLNAMQSHIANQLKTVVACTWTYNKHSTSSDSAVVRMQEGDTLYVQLQHYSGSGQIWSPSSFCCFLIR